MRGKNARVGNRRSLQKRLSTSEGSGSPLMLLTGGYVLKRVGVVFIKLQNKNEYAQRSLFGPK